MLLKEKETVNSMQGSYIISNGIPEGIYTEKQLDQIQKNNPRKNIKKFLVERGSQNVLKNKIVNLGRKELLNIAFETGGNPFRFMHIGDGGYDYSTEKKIFPNNSDVAIRHGISQPIEITSFSAVTGDSISGFVKVLSATFFSEDFLETDYKTQNQTDFFVNEVAILNSIGVLYSLLSFGNYPFDPKNQQALTIQWVIRNV